MPRLRSLLAVIVVALVWACGGQQAAPVVVDDCSEGAAGSGDPPSTGAAPDPEAIDPDAVILDGTPEIPDKLRARMNQYLNTRSAGIAAVSDDGTQMLIRTRFAETYQLHLVSQPLGARRQLTFLEEPVQSAMFVPGDAGRILYRSDVGGTEEYQIFLLDLSSGSTQKLTPLGVRASDFEVTESGRMAYSRNVLGEADTQVWLMDGFDPSTTRPLVTEEGYWYPIDFSADETRLLVGRYISVTESEVWSVDLSQVPADASAPMPNGALTRLTPEEPGAYPFALFAGDDVILATDRDDEFVNLYRWPIDGGEPERLSEGIDWNVEEAAGSPDGRTVVFATNEGGNTRLYAYDLDAGERRPLDVIPSGIAYNLEFAPEAGVLAFSFNGATSGGDVYTLDLETEAVTRWTESEMGGLDPTTFIEPSLISYTSFDGLEVPAFYYRPEGEGPFPVVISIHGGPESQARPYFSPLTQYLVGERDVAVLVPNVRGSDGYGKSYLLLDNGFAREDSVRDIGALLDWTAEQPELDAERIAVMGGSYGGYMVLASLVAFGDRIRAGVDMVGISNFVTFLENTREYRQDLRRAEYGDERDPDMRAHLLSISPTENVDRIESALFVAQGANDPRVPASEAEQIVDAVRATGRDVWYMLAMNEGHGFARQENRDTYTLLTILFFERHLLGD